MQTEIENSLSFLPTAVCKEPKLLGIGVRYYALTPTLSQREREFRTRPAAILRLAD